MEKTVICPGSFDPVTLGHIDIIKRAANMFDKVIVGVFTNEKKTPSFSAEERMYSGLIKFIVGISALSFLVLFLSFHLIPDFVDVSSDCAEN